MSPLSTMSINILCWWTRKDTFLAPVLIGSDIWLFSIHQMVGGASHHCGPPKIEEWANVCYFLDSYHLEGHTLMHLWLVVLKGCLTQISEIWNLMFLPTQIVETSHHSQNLSFLQLHEVWWSRKNWQAWHPLLPPGSSLILLRKSDWGWQHIVAFLSSNWIFHLSKFKMGDSRNCFLWVDFRQSFSQQRAVTIIYPPFNISVDAESWMRAAAKEGQRKITIFSSPPIPACTKLYVIMYATVWRSAASGAHEMTI